MEGTTEREASLLYAVYNFDSVQNSQATNVPSESMSRGAAGVVELLENFPPRLIVPMERRSFDLLRNTLLTRYKLSPDFEFPITIPINDNPKRLHRNLFGYKIADGGSLCGTVVIKFPQHPARIFRPSYAEVCALVVRNLFLQLA